MQPSPSPFDPFPGLAFHVEQTRLRRQTNLNQLRSNLAAADREFSVPSPTSTAASTASRPTPPPASPDMTQLGDLIRDALPKPRAGHPYGDSVLASVVESYARRR